MIPLVIRDCGVAATTRTRQSNRGTISLVFEVIDPQHLQQALEHAVTEVNKEAAVFGKSGLVSDE